MRIVCILAYDSEMKKFIFSLTFLLFLLPLVIIETNAQSFQPFHFLRNAVPFVSVNEHSEGNNEITEESPNNSEKNVKTEDLPSNEVSILKTGAKPDASRITIDLGKALFAKYIK